MMTVNEVSRLSGVSERTLRYYDRIGLLKPKMHTEAGYRLYDGESLRRLRQIMLYRELEFPLQEIIRLMDQPEENRQEQLRRQTELLKLKRERLDRLIAMAEETEKGGTDRMDFSAFDKTQIEAYAAQAKEQWGQTEAYREYEKKSEKRDGNAEKELGERLMTVLAGFGPMKDRDPADGEAQKRVETLRGFITEHYYNCTVPILRNLGMMYTTDAFRENIDAAGGPGTAEYAAKAIAVYCDRNA